MKILNRQTANVKRQILYGKNRQTGNWKPVTIKKAGDKHQLFWF